MVQQSLSTGTLISTLCAREQAALFSESRTKALEGHSDRLCDQRLCPHGQTSQSLKRSRPSATAELPSTLSMSDVFLDEPDAPAIVDCDVLEAAKENIQPLASGRRVTALSAIFSTPHAQRESRLADARRRHRANVEIAMEDEDDDADPLEAYSRFVFWTVENYPQGHSAESGLLELLEEATRVLRDDRDGRWRGDLRYLKLWTLYASYVDKPTIIYKYLLVNEIGTSHALFYEEYAVALERANR